jgi:hypothetical protein
VVLLGRNKEREQEQVAGMMGIGVVANFPLRRHHNYIAITWSVQRKTQNITKRKEQFYNTEAVHNVAGAIQSKIATEFSFSGLLFFFGKCI